MLRSTRVPATARLLQISTHKGLCIDILFNLRRLCRNFSLSTTSCRLPSVASADDTQISGVNDCPKNCLCSRNIEADYKNVRLLSQFVSQQTGMILPRTITRVCLTKQREIAKEIKKAIQMGGIALISYLRLSTTTNEQQLSYIARTRLFTSKFHRRISRNLKGHSSYMLLQLCGGNLFHKIILFEAMETIPAKDQDHTFLPTEARSDIIAHADWLNDHQSADKQYEYVKLQNFQNSEDPELLWRYGRACHCFYTYSDTAREAAKAAAIWDGLSAVEKAVHIDSQNANAFVILGRVTGCGAELCGYKSMIRSSKMAMQCRDHLKRATELDPNNHNAWFSLGIWGYNVSVRPFYEKIVFFQLLGFKPDLNESIAMMEKSNKLLPHPLTSLSIGKCYLYINKKDEAKKWLEEAANFKSSQAVPEGTAHAYSKRTALQLLRKV